MYGCGVRSIMCGIQWRGGGDTGSTAACAAVAFAMMCVGCICYIMQRAIHVSNVLSYRYTTHVFDFNGALDTDAENEGWLD